MGAKSVDRILSFYPSRRQMQPPLKALVDFLRDEHHGALA